VLNNLSLTACTPKRSRANPDQEVCGRLTAELPCARAAVADLAQPAGQDAVEPIQSKAQQEHPVCDERRALRLCADARRDPEQCEARIPDQVGRKKEYLPQHTLRIRAGSGRVHRTLCSTDGLGQTWPLVGARTAAHSVTRRRAMARGARLRTSRPCAGGECAQSLPCTTEERTVPHNASPFASLQRDNRRATRYER